MRFKGSTVQGFKRAAIAIGAGLASIALLNGRTLEPLNPGTLEPSATWTPQTSGVAARLRGVSAVSEKVAFASGSGGVVLRTTDGGATWTKLALPADAAKLDFRDVDAIDARTAYVLSIGEGNNSRIYKTIDGGDTWSI